jgi:hypothetical protein
MIEQFNSAVTLRNYSILIPVEEQIIFNDKFHAHFQFATGTAVV